ncbi:MAG: ribosome maturation factor RimM [Spirochaetes bacterium]|nr:ribosome maturation factor RimM [Spirochaetota bacterium]
MVDAGKEGLLAVAKLGAPRGLGGFLKLQSYSGEYGHLIGLKKVLAAPGSSPEKVKTLTVRAVMSGDWGASFAFEGYDTPETARALTGLEIFLPRSEASPLRKNEYYIHDLVGLSVLLDHRRVGEVVAVLDGGADPLLEILVDGTGARPLVPFRTIFVGGVDLSARSLELLAGWLLE